MVMQVYITPHLKEDSYGFEASLGYTINCLIQWHPALETKPSHNMYDSIYIIQLIIFNCSFPGRGRWMNIYWVLNTDYLCAVIYYYSPSLFFMIWDNILLNCPGWPPTSLKHFCPSLLNTEISHIQFWCFLCRVSILPFYWHIK